MITARNKVTARAAEDANKATIEKNLQEQQR
jgi:hypothetical protein